MLRPRFNRQHHFNLAQGVEKLLHRRKVFNTVDDGAECKTVVFEASDKQVVLLAPESGLKWMKMDENIDVPHASLMVFSDALAFLAYSD